MKLIIDIPDIVFNQIIQDEHKVGEWLNCIEYSIKNGTPCDEVETKRQIKMTNEEMTSEEAIKKIVELCEYKAYNYTILTDEVIKKIDNKALYKAIEALKNEKSKFITSADRRIEHMKHFVHVTINDPKYGEVDGWLDKARQVLFTDAVTTDFAKKVYGWTWKENEK